MKSELSNKTVCKIYLTFAEVSDEHFWKIPFLKELLSVRSNEIKVQGLERNELIFLHQGSLWITLDH